MNSMICLHQIFLHFWGETNIQAGRKRAYRNIQFLIDMSWYPMREEHVEPLFHRLADVRADEAQTAGGAVKRKSSHFLSEKKRPL